MCVWDGTVFERYRSVVILYFHYISAYKSLSYRYHPYVRNAYAMDGQENGEEGARPGEKHSTIPMYTDIRNLWRCQ